MKRTKTTLKVAGGMFLIGFLLAIAKQVEIASYLMAGMMFVLVFILPAMLITDLARRSVAKRAAREAMEADPEYQRRQENLRRMQEEHETIVEVKLIGGGEVKNHKYGAKGAVVGGLMGGVPGAVVGAVLPNGKQSQKQKFLVRYQDGHVETKECKPGSREYEKLIMYVNWEDL